jgi:arylsulfatase A-like enzyme/Tfp pilus assembly protein PilF
MPGGCCRIPVNRRVGKKYFSFRGNPDSRLWWLYIMIKKRFILFIILGVCFFLNAEIRLFSSGSLQGYNLIIITLDTTRADYIGYNNPEIKTLTPHINGLAREGISFQNCFAPTPLTLPSHCSLFTGTYPMSHGVRNNASYALGTAEITLAEIFKKNGYTTHAVISAYVLSSKFGLNQGFEVYDDSLDSTRMVNSFTSEIPADRVYAKFKIWFDTHFNEKFFSWIHFYDPHQPYTPPPPFDERYRNNPYAGEVAFADLYVGKIISDLKKKGIFERTLVVIFGDHGEDLGEHDEYGHGTFCYNESLRVPLIFSNNLGYRSGTRINTRIHLVDVLPSLLELFGMKSRSKTQGESLLGMNPVQSGDENRLIYFESMYPNEEMGWAPVTGIIEGHFKYIHLPKAELYDLKADPGEKNNLYYKKFNVSGKLKKRLEAFVLSHSEKKKAYRKTMSSEDMKHLESLGYISSFKKSKKLIDPKRGMAFKSRLREIKQLIVRKSLDQAENDLKELQASEPDIKSPIVYDFFVEIYMALKNREKLLDIQRRACNEFPHNNQLRINLANSYFNFRNFPESEKLCREIIEIDPGYSRAYILLGKIYLNQQRYTESIDNYRKAIELEPLNQALKKMMADVLIRSGDQAAARTLLLEIGGNKALLANRFDHNLLIQVAARLASLREMDEAQGILTRILKIDSENIQAMNELAEIYLKRRNPDRAGTLYERALKLKPDSALTLANLGVFRLIKFQQTRDRSLLSEALNLFNKSIELDPYHAPAVNGRASVKMFQNRITDAIEDWKKTIDIRPNFYDAYFNLAIAYLRLKKPADALNTLNTLKENYYAWLPAARQNQLQRLIREAEALR